MSEQKKIKKFWLSLDKYQNYYVPSEKVFRLLSHFNFKFNKRRILDVGIANGQNFFEFRRRGAETYGIDIRKKIIKYLIEKHNIKKNLLFNVDLNKIFPNIRNLDLIFCKDLIHYIEEHKKLDFLKWCYNALKSKKYLLLTYYEKEYLFNQKNLFDLNFFKSKSRKTYHEKNNPLPFIKNKKILYLIKKSGFKILSSTFEIITHIKFKNKKKQIITVCRYLFLQKIN